jgi:hypothetical protein
MSYYELLVTVHVLAAIVWVGSDIHAQFLGVRAQKRGAEATATFALDMADWGNRALIASSLLLIITGVLGVIEGPWEFSQAWISIGLTVWVIGFVLGAGFFGPTLKRISGYVAEDGGVMTERSEVLWSRVILATRIQLVLLVIVVIAMVTKPGA